MDAINTQQSGVVGGNAGAARAFAVRAYGPPQGAPHTTMAAAKAAAAERLPGVAQRLVAARVPGQVGFASGGEAVPVVAQGALAMYRNPADKNAAAVGVEAGRVLDVRG